MIFLPTCASDATADLLIPFLERETDVFRFDIDRFRDYRWDESTEGLSIRNSSGNGITA